MTTRYWLHGLLLLQLFVVIVAPNSESYLGYRTQSFLVPYSEFLELAGKWNFFAPDPGPPPVYLEWELNNKSGEAYLQGKWPDEGSPFFLSDRQTRRVSAVHFMTASNDRAEKMMVPYLCEKHPEARSVSLWAVMYTIPTLENIQNGSRKLGDDVGSVRQQISTTFCPNEKDGKDI